MLRFTREGELYGSNGQFDAATAVSFLRCSSENTNEASY